MEQPDVEQPDEELAAGLSRLAPEVDETVARAEFVRRRGRARRRRRVGRGVAAATAAGVVALVGFGVSAWRTHDTTQPLEVGGEAGDAGRETLVWRSFTVEGAEVWVRLADDLAELPEVATEVELAGTIIDEGAGSHLCPRVLFSYPPQCGGDAVLLGGLDASELAEWGESAAGTRWADRTVRVSWPPVDGRVEMVADRPYEAPPELPPGAGGVSDRDQMVLVADRASVREAVADVAARGLDPSSLRFVSWAAILAGAGPALDTTDTTVPGTVPTTVPGTVPTTVSGTVPTTVPGTVPTTVPGTAPTTVPGTVPTTVPGTAPAQLFVTQVQTGCCYVEGSLGLLEVLDNSGTRVGPITAAGEPSGDVDEFYLHSSWELRQLAAGRYTVNVWQLPGIGPGPSEDYADWEVSADRGAERPDLCTVEVTVEPGTFVELQAVWAPGQGCEFVAP